MDAINQEIENRIDMYQNKLEKLSVCLDLLVTTVPSELVKETVEYLSDRWDSIFLQIEELEKNKNA